VIQNKIKVRLSGPKKKKDKKVNQNKSLAITYGN
jgi:hypothetical protein